MWPRSSDLNMQSTQLALNGDGYDIHHEAISSRLWHQSWMPGCSVYLPENYTDSYSYPLVCFLHDDERSHRDLTKWFPSISDQNYIAVGIQAPFPHATGLPGKYLWNDHRIDAAQAVIREALALVLSEWNVHPDRIALLGEGRGAIVALQQLLLSQSGFGNIEQTLSGAICRQLPPHWTRLLPPFPNQMDGRLLLLESPECADADAAIECLQESGIEVSFPGLQHRSMHTAINHWLMGKIATAIY